MSNDHVTSSARGSDAPTSAMSGDLTAVAGSLHREFDGRLGSARVDTEIHRVADRFADATVRAFVPLFVRRYAGHELDDQSEHRDVGASRDSR